MRRRVHAGLFAVCLMVLVAQAVVGDAIPPALTLFAASGAPLALLGWAVPSARLPGGVLAALAALTLAFAGGVAVLHARILERTISPDGIAVALVLLLAGSAVVPGVVLALVHARRVPGDGDHQR